jgi:CRP/FNR family transcriptional regulator, cyclic AMP receptor protein
MAAIAYCAFGGLPSRHHRILQSTAEKRPAPQVRDGRAKISQETLADMIGTTRSRVSFFMNKFRKLGFIDYNGCIEVRSSLFNVVLHDEPHIEI